MADKKEMKIFTLSEYEEEEQYLNQMARSGYLFEKVTLPGVYHFRKIAPVNMVYRIDFNPRRRKTGTAISRCIKTMDGPISRI